MPVETISWKSGKVRYIDQTRLPHKLEYIDCSDPKKLWKAIRGLEIRGAPAIGIAGALGVILGIKDLKAKNFSEFFKKMRKVVKFFASARPTAINLFWALDRMECAAKDNSRNKKYLIKGSAYDP